MSKFTMFLASAASVVTLAAPVLAQDTTADTVVATINGTDITVGHMIITRAQLPQQYQTISTRCPVFRHFWIS